MNTNTSAANIFINADLKGETARVRTMFETHGGRLADLVNSLITTEQANHIVTNVKGAMRVIQSLCFTLGGDVRYYDASTAFIVSAVALSTQSKINYASLHLLQGYRKEGTEGANVKGVQRPRLVKFLGTVGTNGTISSKTTRTVGKNGFLTAMGITTKSDNSTVELAEGAKSNAYIVLYSHALERMTDGAFALIQEKQEKSGK